MIAHSSCIGLDGACCFPPKKDAGEAEQQVGAPRHVGKEGGGDTAATSPSEILSSERSIVSYQTLPPQQAKEGKCGRTVPSQHGRMLPPPNPVWYQPKSRGGLSELCFGCRFFYTPTHSVSALSIYTLSTNMSFKLATKIGMGCAECRARGWGQSCCPSQALGGVTRLKRVIAT